MNTWDLSSIYTGFEDPKLLQDEATLDTLIEKMKQTIPSMDPNNPKSLREVLNFYIEANALASTLFSYASLTTATDVTNNVANNYLSKMQKKMIQLTQVNVKFEKDVASIPNIQDLCKTDALLAEHEFYLSEIKNQSSHLLSDKEEILAAQLRQSGSVLWNRLWNTITSTLKIHFKDTEYSLPAMRNFAHDPDPKVRKDAYYAELKAYQEINKTAAFCMNAIKNEVITISKLRGYASPLARTLEESRLNQDILDALLGAIHDSLPAFTNYLKHKANLLGYKDALPFYDLFAPIGATSKEFTIPEAEQFILTHFNSYSKNLFALAKKAFDNNWVDYTPRLNKRGGAFCAKVFGVKESRILTNFSGSIGDVITMAHELGHAYHNEQIFKESILNSSYSASIAETASVLAETIVKKAAIKESKTKEEKIAIIEQELQDSTQVIVDIYSRFLFENRVFNRAENEFLTEDILNEEMKNAQLASYQNGLDPDVLHESMWVNKPHYYSSGLSYYNFPYAFGLLFSKGIYAMYLEKGPSFTDQVDMLLQNTGKMNIQDVAKSIGIDITTKEFWKSSLDIILEDIHQFIELTKGEIL